MRSDESLVPWALTFAICISMPSAMQKELQDLGGAAAANQPARLAIFCAVLRWGEALRRAGAKVAHMQKPRRRDCVHFCEILVSICASRLLSTLKKPRSAVRDRNCVPLGREAPFETKNLSEWTENEELGLAVGSSRSVSCGLVSKGVRRFSEKSEWIPPSGSY